MARVTVEDCIEKVDNRFELILMASHRSRMISAGADLTVDRDNDKNPVVTLREIADETISADDLREDLIHSMQKYVDVDEAEPEVPPAPVFTQDEAEGDAPAVPAIEDMPMDRMSEEDLLRGLEGLGSGK